jgi:hypothetical protein
MHVRGLRRAHDMTYLADRRLEGPMRAYRLETMELPDGGAGIHLQPHKAIAKGGVKIQVVN